jgi:FdhE protein
VRQGEITKGKWMGNPLGGVKAPQALVLPDPTTRFARAAARLEALSPGHPMEDWLCFMAKLARAQHSAAECMGPLPELGYDAVEQAVEARMPPLSADGHRRAAAWRDALATLLDSFDDQDVPAAARTVMADLRKREATAIETLADSFLHGSVESADVGPALYVAAALQVYFTNMAVALPEASLRLLPQPAAAQHPSRVWCLQQAKTRGHATYIVRSVRRPGITCAPCASPAGSLARSP